MVVVLGWIRTGFIVLSCQKGAKRDLPDVSVQPGRLEGILFLWRSIHLVKTVVSEVRLQEIEDGVGGVRLARRASVSEIGLLSPKRESNEILAKLIPKNSRANLRRFFYDSLSAVHSIPCSHYLITLKQSQKCQASSQSRLR